jgi:uncharacterized membrane protein
MADLIAIGYDDETTAAAAAEVVGRLAKDPVIEPDAVAVIVRNHDGEYKLLKSSLSKDALHGAPVPA